LDDSVVNDRNFSFKFQEQSEEASHFDTQDHIQHPCESLGGKEDNYCFRKRKQKLLSPLSEDEIDQLLKCHVTAQVNAGLQCLHSQEGVSEASSTFENENLSLMRIVLKLDLQINMKKDNLHFQCSYLMTLYRKLL